MAERINSVRDLEVYRLAFDTAMEIFQITKAFPVEENDNRIKRIKLIKLSVKSAKSCC